MLARIEHLRIEFEHFHILMGWGKISWAGDKSRGLGIESPNLMGWGRTYFLTLNLVGWGRIIY